MRLGVASLSSYTAGLAFEGAHFQSKEDIFSKRWSVNIQDTAKILHVNGVSKLIEFLDGGKMVLTYSVSSPPAVVITCSSAGLKLRLGQHIQSGGDLIDGPKLTLTYPIDLIFEEDTDIEVALDTMDRVREGLSLIMGRVLPIANASIIPSRDGGSTEVSIHGLPITETADRPTQPILTSISPKMLAAVMDRWLSRYDELSDAIRLHMSGLEQRRLPTELRFQIFIQALEALHRRISPTEAQAIDSSPITAILQERGFSSDIIDRVRGVLAHAHEPGLRQRLRYYWDKFEQEISTLRPDETRKVFVSRVAATRNHYAHRTDRDEQVLDGTNLWDATETLKAISHMALLNEMGADTTRIGQAMLDRRFAEYVIEE